MPSDVHPSRARSAPLVVLSGGLISHIHTVMGFLAFFGALITALSLHYPKVVKNHVAQYPDEWWPSVSATIGDWYPERNIFQVGIALMAGPRFALVLLSALLVSLSTPIPSPKASILLCVGVLRTLACGGWVYVTSTDDHLVHDIAMFVYLALTPPWMFITSGSLAQPPSVKNAAKTDDQLASKARKMRRIACFSFFACTPFMGFFFYRHNALRIPGAYSYYAYFEWGLIIFDLLFDAASVYDLSRFQIHIVEAPLPDAPSPPATNMSTTHGPEEKRLIDGAWIRGGRSQAIASGAWSAAHSDSLSDGRSTASQNRNREPIGNVDKTLPNHMPLPCSPTSLKAIVSLVSDCYLAFCFWTALTALHPMIFYFSVYNLAIGGHEALLISQVIGLGLTLAVPALRSCVRRQSADGASTVGPISSQAKALGWLLSLVGQASWFVADPLVRLISVAFSNALLAVLLALEWGAAWESDQLSVKVGIWLIGLLASNLAKYANHSNNPAWPFMDSTNGGHNVVFLALALLAVTETALRPKYNHLPVVRRRHGRQSVTPTQHDRVSVSSEQPGSFYLAALGAGALLYAVHIFLTDTGTMIAWGWTGYPITGPMAIPHGCIILITMAFSSLAATRWSTFGYRLSLFLVQCGSAALLHLTDDWGSFAGAIGIALSLPALSFPLISAAMHHDPIKVMLFAWLVANLLTFFGVLTVAYAFVPGGKIMRERTGLMLVVHLMLLGGGLINARSVDLRRLSSQRDADGPSRHHAKPSNSKEAKTDSSRKAAQSGSSYYICLFMAFIGLVGNLVPLYRIVPASSIVPHHPQERLVTAGMWTVHFALDQHMRDSSRRMASIMKTLDMDLFGLVESDLHRPVFGNRDLSQYLAEELKMYADIGPAPSKNTWGAALFSKFPIINSTHHLLPSPGGELAPAIHAVIDLYGTPTHVIVSHNGQEEDPLDRELQTTEIARILREAYPHPAIFLGYVVTKPHAERPAPYKILFEDGKIQDVEPTDFGRWCEYLGLRGLERISYVRVSRYTVTDTELQTMKLVVPKEPIDPDRNDLTNFVIAETYPESMRYPTSLIDPDAFVYDKHIYSPYPWPIYYGRPTPDF